MSTRQDYKVAALRAKVDERRERRMLEETQKKIDLEDIEGRVNTWRGNAETRVLDLARRLDIREGQPGYVSDAELSGWQLAPMPVREGRYGKSPQRAYDDAVEQINKWYTTAMDRLDVIKADRATGEPVLSLTPTMLNDLLGL